MLKEKAACAMLFLGVLCGYVEGSIEEEREAVSAHFMDLSGKYGNKKRKKNEALRERQVKKREIALAEKCSVVFEKRGQEGDEKKKHGKCLKSQETTTCFPKAALRRINSDLCHKKGGSSLGRPENTDSFSEYPGNNDDLYSELPDVYCQYIAGIKDGEIERGVDEYFDDKMKMYVEMGLFQEIMSDDFYR
ncbi:MAG: uncharacterized protein A8A55_1400 [Amphiamblys sp. WSBS2006]|nr:MAG: uncharacterized protein A8A55_1400 [Amphiamblys sp. WSBS2006]